MSRLPVPNTTAQCDLPSPAPSPNQAPQQFLEPPSALASSQATGSDAPWLLACSFTAKGCRSSRRTLCCSSHRLPCRFALSVFSTSTSGGFGAWDEQLLRTHLEVV